MIGGEPSATAAVTTGSTDHDMPLISADMNASGQAVIAFHKKGLSTLDTSECSSYRQLYVTTYDPFNGFDSIASIDDETGDTMHAQVAITPNGNIAIVWETVVSTTLKYVYLKTKINGTWSSNIVVNSSSTMQNSLESMMPSVGIRDSGDIVVTFSYGATQLARRQYVYYYFFH
jgi:hypothetical protein